jgi:hypothetical protein
MALAIRVAPLPGRWALFANGRTYAVAGAATVDVPYDDGLAIGPDQAQRLAVVGATTDRPAYLPGGVPVTTMMSDETLGEMIFLVANSLPPIWVDISGTPV